MLSHYQSICGEGLGNDEKHDKAATFSKVRRNKVVFIANNRTVSCALLSVSLYAGSFCNWNHR